MYQDDALNFFRAAAEAPDRPALLYQQRIYAYRDLVPLVTRASQSIPASKRELVALCAPNSLDTYCLLLAMISEKIPFVLIHPRLTPSERQVILDDAKPSLYITSPTTSWSPLSIHGEGQGVRFSGPFPSALAILYTSGTTGVPKGAILPRSAFLASAWASEQNLGWRDDDRWLLCLPLCHIGGLSIVTRCLLARRCVILQDRFEAKSVLHAITEQQATLLSVVPTMLKALLEEDRDNQLSSLRAVLLGGAATPESMQRECAARQIHSLTTYGLTEACSQVTTQRLRERALFEPGSGEPLAGTSVAITDEDGALLPTGEIGQIVVKGPTLMLGYLHHAPLNDDGLRTGDLGFFDTDGKLHVMSRHTDLIVSGGENVYPLEVERVLESCIGVERALVFAAPDETWGQLVAAALIVTERFSQEELQRERTERLAPHKRPRLFCVVSELPTLPSGKPNRAGAFELLRPTLKAL